MELGELTPRDKSSAPAILVSRYWKSAYAHTHVAKAAPGHDLRLGFRQLADDQESRGRREAGKPQTWIDESFTISLPPSPGSSISSLNLLG